MDPTVSKKKKKDTGILIMIPLKKPPIHHDLSAFRRTNLCFKYFVPPKKEKYNRTI